MPDINLNDEFMKQVSQLYKENHSLQKTADQMGLAYGKVRKILITLGEYQTPFSLRVAELRQSGLSVSGIAAIVGASEKRITAFLPYEKGIYDAPDLTLDAKKSKNYRQRMDAAAKNIVSAKYGCTTYGCTENKRFPDNIIEKKDFYPVRLHLELQNEWCGEEERHLLTKYADAAGNGTLKRDILIPSDMPLHNLHYAIQRLYGWQNSHLRCFRLEEKDYERLTGGKVKGWMDLVGVLFHGFPEDENDAFWDDVYTGGSFKVWLKKKYTGPYSYGGYVETYDVAKDSVNQFARRFPVLEVSESFHDYRERTRGKKAAENEPMRILKKAPIMDLSLEELNNSIVIEDSMDSLLERLEVISVLALPEEKLADARDLGTRLVNPVYENNNGTTSGMEAPEVFPVTHKILYKYDFGDNWVVEITRSDNCRDLLDAGKLSAEDLCAAEQIVMEKHKPVCISRKGAYVVDDVGGMRGYADFISAVYENNDKDLKREYREWAESLGWSSRKVSPDKML
jgi:hypothetical protein